MAGDNLESRLILKDEASEVLKEVASQSELTECALTEVQEALKAIEAVGEIKIDVADTPKPKAPKPEKDEAWARESTDTPQDDSAWKEAEQSVQQTVALFEETNEILSEVPRAAENVAQTINESIEALENELHDTIDISLLEEVNAKREKSWKQLMNEIEDDSEVILREWEQAEQGLLDMSEEIEKGTEKAEKELKKGARGLGADIGGWWSIIKDVFNKLSDAFGKLAEESDKLNTRMARFGLVADAEGKKGADRGTRSAELYGQHQKFAQALGVKSEAFNETVLNMYSNGAGVVKSIEDAQKIAASSYMAMDVAGLRGSDKDAVMGEIQSMISVGIADPDQIQNSMKIAPNILRTIEKQWQENLKGKAFKLKNGKEIKDATGKIAVLAQEGQITAELVSQAMINSAQETHKTWNTLPATWEKLKNRIRTITENITADIVKKFGELADDPQVADFIMSAMRMAESVLEFTKSYILPVIGGVVRYLMTALTLIFNLLSSWKTAIPTIVATGAALAAVAFKAGLLQKALVAVNLAIAAIKRHPIVAIISLIAMAVVAVAQWVMTTQEGQETMLKVTSAISYGFKQVAAVLTSLDVIGSYVISQLEIKIKSLAVTILNEVEVMLKGLAEISDTAEEMLESVRATRQDLTKDVEEAERTANEGMQKLQQEFEKNTKEYNEYNANIPELAKANLNKSKDELKLTGFLDDILKGQKKAPGTPNNPAHVKGKVGIDGEFFDIIKRAAGVEIVNRYTTLRPTVHASFGDIHKMDAEDIIGELGKQIQKAEGAALSDAQALGA